MNQLKRVAVYNEFCRKKHAVLFATDIAARGLGKYIMVILYIVMEVCFGSSKACVVYNGNFVYSHGGLFW